MPERRSWCVLFALLLLSAGPLLGLPADTKPDLEARKRAVEALPEKYRAWVETVDILLTDEEWVSFLALTKDYQRDAFIDRFWQVRDENPRTPRNEFRDGWETRTAEALRRYGDLKDARARALRLNGIPDDVLTSDCPMILWPLEVWYFSHSERTKRELVLILYRKWGAGRWRIWDPAEGGIDTLLADGAATEGAPVDRDWRSAMAGEESKGGFARVLACGPDDKGKKIAAAIGWILEKGNDWPFILQKADSSPAPPGAEWVPTFESYLTDVPAGAPALEAKLDVEFPGRQRSRTVLQGLVAVPASEAGVVQLAGSRSYNFLLTGEVLTKETDEPGLFDRFRFRFDVPASEAPAGSTIPLVFQRPLRPGEYTLVLKVEDLNSGRFYRVERPLTVPLVEAALPPPPPADPDTARVLAAANQALANGDTVVQILPPPGELPTGMNRFDTLTSGDIAQVVFSLDGKPVLTKRKPPFSVELDLGALPRPRTLTAVGYDAAGRELARDERLVNAAANRFRLRLAEPRRGEHYESSVPVRAEVEAPDGETIERVEIFLDETRVATLYQPPYNQAVILPKDQPLAYVRAVAYLSDGNSTEDLVFVNAPDYLEEMDVDFVELYTSVTDRQGRPVEGLAAKDFKVSEDGVPQTIARFEKVTDLPIHAAVALDVSASMEDSLDQTRTAALQFLEQSVRPKDRAAVITFNDRPFLAVKFTKDVNALAGGLAGLKAERGTALYDTIVFTLFYFNGVKGQRAILLLSDGKDEGSRFGWEEALDYARRAGVAIYPIGLGPQVEKPKLKKLAEETGGRAFFLEDVSGLGPVYAAIEEELRSKYLIAYQSTNTGGGDTFRTVDLKVAKSGVEVKTMRGYYP
ncbi:MAG: VWA domain-containing protein [Acidobacteriota bacterium]